jgi:hypothetical protein
MPRKNRKQKSVITESPVADSAEVEYVTDEPVAVVKKVPNEVKQGKPKRKYVRKKKVVESVTEGLPDETVSAPVDIPVVKVKKPRKPRKPSSYNTYMATQMKTAEIRKLPPKTRLAQIGKNWKIHKASLVTASA